MAPPASTEEGEFDSFHDFNPKARPRPPGSPAKQIERCVISSFRVAESMGFKGEFRSWEIGIASIPFEQITHVCGKAD